MSAHIMIKQCRFFWIFIDQNEHRINIRTYWLGGEPPHVSDPACVINYDIQIHCGLQLLNKKTAEAADGFECETLKLLPI